MVKIKINFGVSEFSKLAPGVPLEERTREIPETGGLKKLEEICKSGEITYLRPDEVNPIKCCILNYTDYSNRKFTELPAIRFQLAGKGIFDEQMYLIWIEERGEWVAFTHTSWPEGSLGQPDVSEHGPYALDGYCEDMLYKVHRLSEQDIERNEVSKTNPQCLLEKYIRKEIKRRYYETERERSREEDTTFSMIGHGKWDIAYDMLSDKITKGVLAVATTPNQVEIAINYIFKEIELVVVDIGGDSHSGFYKIRDAVARKAIALANNTSELHRLVEEK